MKKALIRMGVWQQPIIIIGTGKAAEKVAKAFMADPFIGYRVLGFIGEHYTNQNTIQDLPVLGLDAELGNDSSYQWNQAGVDCGNGNRFKRTGLFGEPGATLSQRTYNCAKLFRYARG